MTDDLDLQTKLALDKARAEIFAMMEWVRTYYIGTIKLCGFKIVLWKTGIEICRPRLLDTYKVYIFRWWWPPAFMIRIDGHWTSAAGYDDWEDE